MICSEVLCCKAQLREREQYCSFATLLYYISTNFFHINKIIKDKLYLIMLSRNMDAYEAATSNVRRGKNKLNAMHRLKKVILLEFCLI